MQRQKEANPENLEQTTLSIERPIDTASMMSFFLSDTSNLYEKLIDKVFPTFKQYSSAHYF